MVATPGEVLTRIGAVEPDAVRTLHPRVRDRDDVSVLRCEASGVIFLSSAEHMSLEHYEDKVPDAAKVSGTTLPRPVPLSDDLRRSEEIHDLVAGRRWLDVGTGEGVLLDLLHGVAGATVGVEPTEVYRQAIAARGHEVYWPLSEAGGATAPFEVVTLFHVLEHLIEPVDTLTEIRSVMAPGGVLHVEVPHARDLLLTEADTEPFRDFTFWSEHLVLHTRESLALVLEAGGFSDVEVFGLQRYPVANHLHWLAAGRPGGHVAWAELDSPDLRAAYAAVLDRLDRTDTLVARARA
jgi:hypothetical protein